MQIKTSNISPQAPLISFLIDITLLFSIFYGIVQYYDFWEIQILLDKNRSELVLIQENINNLQSTDNYINSLVYKEKLRKDLNYQKEGEIIIDVSGLEDVDQQPTIFKPKTTVNNLTNLEKWWICFFDPVQIRCFP